MNANKDLEEKNTTLQSENVELAKERNILANERTHLAAQRTLSAWIRTGLASVGGGFAIVRLLSFEQVTHRLLAHAVGEILIIWGMSIFILALLNYKASCKQLNTDVSKMNEWWITTTIFIFFLASLFLFFVTLT